MLRPPLSSSCTVWLSGLDPICDRGQCGSCWSFSVTGAIEGALFVDNGELVSLSEQEMVACDKTNSGCGGGNPASAISWVKSNPLCTEEAYPYTSGGGQSGSCLKNCNPAVTVTGTVPVTQGSETSLLSAVQNRPVSIALNSSPQSIFQLYKSGVLDGSCAATLDHAVLVVGFGTDSATGKEYWKVRSPCCQRYPFYE